ncbi:putative iron-regulated protein [Mucilaginibacter frigoritolerans]|uniref:Putative iron-regulated protein n=1 Tax=Mucilaginibacter frigoritolerans TaxID=652788 RepID=A0A562TRR3_9SPHI|nr:ChaN family lipoprotein [Mucilaginibacter frigoritolerans]TWI96279.1 putative iron-regulated protein [Mucilaginibacter frigoritolerans]
MKIFGIILFILLPIISFSQDSLANHYKIYNTSKQKIVTVDDIINDMSKSDVLFFGEEHDDSTGHYLEYKLLKKLEDKYPNKVALSMEMFETDCQNVLNEYLYGLIREKNFRTDTRVWPNYKDYSLLIEFAKTNHMPVIAANAPSRYTNMVNRLGLNSLQQLSTIGKSYLPPLPIDTATGTYYEKFTQIMGGHASTPGMQMYQAQNLWDATMGWSIAKFIETHKGYKILQLNGGFHSEEKLGAVAQLKRYAHNVRILNIAVYSDESFENPDWIKLSKNGDYIILTDPKLPKTF